MPGMGFGRRCWSAWPVTSCRRPTPFGARVGERLGRVASDEWRVIWHSNSKLETRDSKLLTLGMTAEEWQVVWFTAWVSALSPLVILPFGLATAWVLARREWPGKSVVETFISLPLVLPPVAPGLLLLKLFGRRGPVGGFL